MLATRETRTVVVHQRISSTRTLAREVTTFVDATAFDALHHVGRISDRQHAAATRLYGHFLAAGLGRSCTMDYRVAPEADPDDWRDGDVVDAEEARAVYRRMLIGAGCTMGPALDAIMHGQHPGWALDVVRAGLDYLADGWGML